MPGLGVPVVKSLLHKHEDLSLGSQRPQKSQLCDTHLHTTGKWPKKDPEMLVSVGSWRAPGLVKNCGSLSENTP